MTAYEPLEVLLPEYFLACMNKEFSRRYCLEALDIGAWWVASLIERTEGKPWCFMRVNSKLQRSACGGNDRYTKMVRALVRSGLVEQIESEETGVSTRYRVAPCFWHNGLVPYQIHGRLAATLRRGQKRIDAFLKGFVTPASEATRKEEAEQEAAFWDAQDWS